MEKDDNGTILIKNQNDVIYIIDKPFMYDNAFHYSDKVEIQLSKKGNNTYSIKIIPDKEWLLSENIVYPITIDPTISTSLSATAIEDTFIYEGDYNNPNRYQAHILRVGSNKYLKNPTRSLIKFTLPELNSGDQVIYALLDIRNYPDTNEWTPSSEETYIDIHKITNAWNSQTANWQEMNDKYDSKIEDYIIYKYTNDDPVKFNYFDITSIVKDWYTTGNNFGVMLKDHIETYNANKSDAYFFSSDIHGDYQYCRPMVQIVYRNQTGIENYMTYHTQNVGRAGTVYINDYNGNMVLTHEDITTPGNRLPIQLKHIFNSNDKEIDIGYGKGFRTNYSQEITLNTINNIEYAIYIDEDGTRIYLEKKEDIYIDEAGEGYILKKDGDNFILIDNAKNEFKFIKRNIEGKDKWHLKEAKDAYGNKIILTLNESGDFRITKIEDPAGGYINFTYNGNLSSISSQSGEIINFEYENGNLGTIYYNDGQCTHYAYEGNRIFNVKNIDNSSVNYEYYTSNISKVKKITELGRNGETGNYLEISYGYNTTTFKDNKGYSNIYTFDDLGRTISIGDFGKDDSVNGAYGKYLEYSNEKKERNNLEVESEMISIKDMPNNLIKNPYFDENLNYWNKNNCEAIDSVSLMSENNVFKFSGSPYEDKNICQKIITSGEKGDIYNISCWVKTNSIPNRDLKSTRITVSIIQDDNNKTWIDIPINTDNSNWQFVSKQFITDRPYQSIEVYLICYYNANETYFDNIGLYKDESGNSYKYDNAGNIVSSKEKLEKESKFAYNVNNNLSSMITSGGNKYSYEYDYNNPSKLIRAKTGVGTSIDYNYDEFGNITKITAKEKDESDIPINNNVYYIKFANGLNYFDVHESGTENQTNVHLWSLNSGNNQKFRLETISNGFVRLHPLHDETLSVRADLETNNVELWKTNDAKYDQKWKFIKNEDGSYRIENHSKGSNYVMTAVGNNQEPGAEIELKEWNGSDSQKVYIYNVETTNKSLNHIVESNGIYYIKSKKSGLYLEQKNNEIGSTIVQNKFNPNDKGQLWQIKRVNENSYVISNLENKDGNVIDVLNASNTNDNNIQMQQNTTPNPAQEWILETGEDGTFYIKTKLTGGERCISIYANNNDEGQRMIIYDKNGGDNQKFYLEKANLYEIEPDNSYKIKVVGQELYVGEKNGNVELVNNNGNNEWIINDLNNGYYQLKLKNGNNKVMDLDCAGTDNGTNIKVYEYNGNDAQQFELVPTTEGTYYIKIKPAKGKKTIDISGGIFNEGTNIQQWECNETNSQKFELIKTSNVDNKKYLEVGAEYSENGNYQTKIIDLNGTSISYEYNTQTGNLNKTVDQTGEETIYEYDTNNRIISSEKSVRQNGYVTYKNEYTYLDDRLSTIKHNDTLFTFQYDSFGNVKSTKVNDKEISLNTYEENNGNLLKTTYGNGQSLNYTYDRFNRITNVTGTNGIYKYYYDGKSNINKIEDTYNDTTENYNYDLSNRLISLNNTNGFGIQYSYNNNSNINKKMYKLNEKNNSVDIEYDQDNKNVGIKFSDEFKMINNYDLLGRIANKNILQNDNEYRISYEYKNLEGNRTTASISSITNGNNEKLIYKYDERGNISSVKEGENTLKQYSYDDLNQLWSVEDIENNLSVLIDYDAGGNISERKTYIYNPYILENPIKTETFEYNPEFKDQLIKYNDDTLTYDDMGNLTSFRNWNYTWENGTQLKSLTNNSENVTIEYKYDSNGIRTEKKVNDKIYQYYLEGNKVIYENQNGKLIYYNYDGNGDLIGFNISGEQYYYIRNVQNDIIGILDDNFNQIVKYNYDSWGNIISILDDNGNDVTNNIEHIGNINPYRFKGYRYDNETKMYYLNYRYYNPEIGRFISFDNYGGTVGDLLSHNGYIYCKNNPINMTDESGNFALSTAATALAGGLTALAKVLGIVVLTYAIVNIVQEIVERIPKPTEGFDDDSSTGYTVYTLKKDDEVVYVGRTTNPNVRKKVHEKTKPGTIFNIEKSNLTKAEARGVEQIYIMKYNTLEDLKKLNKINGISPKNNKSAFYMTKALKLVGHEVGQELLEKIDNLFFYY